MLDVVDPPNPPPTCSILHQGNNSEGAIRVIVIDDPLGIGKITVKESVNVLVDIPEFNTNENNISPKSVTVDISKIDESISAFVILEMIDNGGSRSECNSGDF